MKEIQKNALERIRIEKGEYKGNDVITMWVFYQGKDGQWRPTKKGLSFGAKILPDLVKAMQTFL